MTRLSLWPVIFSCVLLTVLSGCRSVTPPVKYYALSAISRTAEEGIVEGNRPINIGIQPVQLPGYFNRTQMMTRSGRHELQVSSLHRWVDYPDRLVQQILGDNLQVLMPHARVVNFPWPVGFKPDITVSVHFLELIGTSDGQMLLGAVWRITPAGQLSVPSHRTILAEPMPGKGFDDLAAAHSRVLAILCRAVADTLHANQEALSGQVPPSD